MAKTRHSAEQIVHKLREPEVELAKGARVKEVCRKLAITEHTCYRWRREYGGLKLDQAKRLKQLKKENTRLKKLLAEKELDLSILQEVAEGKLLSPARRREAVVQVRRELGVSERRACRVLKQPRTTQRYVPKPANEGTLTERVIELAREYGRYGYRRVTALLRVEGWRVNPKRVQRIWRREGAEGA